MILRYFLKGLLLPPSSQLLMLLLAWTIWHRYKKTARLLTFFAVASLWLLATPLLATYLSRGLEVDSAIKPEQLTDLQADVIVILSASQDESAPEFGQPVSGEDQLVRLRYGAFLQKKTGLPVLLTGGSVSGKEQRSLAETMDFDLSTSFGTKAAWLEKRSKTTAENALFSHEILAPEGKTTILLVTSAMHMRRASWSFERVGFTVLPAPTHFLDRDPVTINSFLPSAHALSRSSEVIHEWLGIWVYKILHS